MRHRIPKLLYFSLDEERISWFWSWVGRDRFNYSKSSIFLKAEGNDSFHHAADLSLFLNQYEGNLQSLHIIVDLESFQDCSQMDILRDTVIEFPEVQFLFDKRYRSDKDLISLLFPKDEMDAYLDSFSAEDKKQIENLWGSIIKGIDNDLLEVRLDNPDEEYEPSIIFGRIINGYDNTFDASNLRYAIKYRKYLHLKVDHNRNFEKIQDSRFNHLAICVEEEVRQNVFNSYALYVNGFRVFPVSTRVELEFVNKKSDDESPLFHSLQNRVEGIIVRDYDLQFEDEDQQPVDEIRGFRFCEEHDLKQDSAFSMQVGRKNLQFYKNGWNDLRDKYNGHVNKYWHSIKERFPMYFITKGPKHSDIIHPERLKDRTMLISSDGQQLVLPGFTKPVCGLYCPFQGLPEVWSTYADTRYSVSGDGSKYEIKTARKEHDHSTPLDIYDMANNMIRRAESYYSEKRYLLAALVSGEALEFLNGFHHRLMIKAYYIQAIAENAIAMDVVGGNEHYLAKDAAFRVEKIKDDVARFYYHMEENSSRNVLNQIFSTCRQFCQKNEHFESEEVFIRAMGHLLEGLTIKRLFKNIGKSVFKLFNR